MFSLGKYQSAHKAAIRPWKQPGESCINCSFYQRKSVFPKKHFIKQTTGKVVKEQQVPGPKYKDKTVCKERL